jgi:hypothetical protein
MRRDKSFAYDLDMISLLRGSRNVELISITYRVFCKVELDSVIVVFVFVLCVSVFWAQFRGIAVQEAGVV